METKATVRFISGREEQFEVELFGGTAAETRLKEFVRDPTIVLQTEEEIIIIPSTAVECIILPFPEFGRDTLDFQGIRKARRLK
jgi:hypothetical protein